MAAEGKGTAGAAPLGATVGYTAELWQIADSLRESMNAAEQKEVIPELFFLEDISDASGERRAELLAKQSSGADPQDADEFRAQSICGVPPYRRWHHMKAQARQCGEGKKGGEFYTPRCAVKRLVEMRPPHCGRVSKPCRGASDRFQQSVDFLRARAKDRSHGDNSADNAKADISIRGQESSYPTWRCRE